VDVFLSASTSEVDRLAAAGRIAAATRVDLASNRLVIAQASDARPLGSIAELSGARFQRIAIGQPRTVPAGRYAEETLRKLGLWERLEPRFITCENVRQVLDYVARGEVDAGFVYGTDVLLLPDRVVATAEAPADSHAPIRYQGVVLAGAAHGEAGRQFLALLTAAEGQNIFKQLGFLPPLGP
jgi:molybdate transport system substrate-binding protein